MIEGERKKKYGKEDYNYKNLGPHSRKWPYVASTLIVLSTGGEKNLN